MKKSSLMILLVASGYGVSSQPAWFNNSVAPDTVFTGYMNVLRYNAPACNNKVLFTCTGGTIGLNEEEFTVIANPTSKVVTVNMYCEGNNKKAVATRVFSVVPLSKERAEKLRASQQAKEKK